jgi:hypothetical protein
MFFIICNLLETPCPGVNNMNNGNTSVQEIIFEQTMVKVQIKELENLKSQL